MQIEVRPCTSDEEVGTALNAIGHYFGHDYGVEDGARFAQWIERERMLAAYDGDLCVGGAGSLTYRMSVPGGDAPTAGVTVVGVLPTHRRRGVLTTMMHALFDDARERGDVLAYLWASEATIYGRFGFSLASVVGEMTLARDRARFAEPFAPRGVVRLVGEDEAVRLFPPLYERVYAQRPGMFTRDRAWWAKRRLHDDPERRRGSGPLHRALLELDGEPAGYALYKVEQSWEGGSSSGEVTILEAVAPTPQAARELWRWLLDFDWTSKFVADLLPLDHELFLLLAEPRRMRFQLNDGVWVRPVDVLGALSARTYRDAEPVVLDVTDAFLPDNAGRYRVGADGVDRTSDEADLRLDVTGVGSVYLGGFSFADLVRGSRAEELTAGAARRADDVFGTGVQPWCPEIF
jgi:predicted acetyltransferase